MYVISFEEIKEWHIKWFVSSPVRSFTEVKTKINELDNFSTPESRGIHEPLLYCLEGKIVNWLQICELKSVIINRNEDIDGRVTSYH